MRAHRYHSIGWTAAVAAAVAGTGCDRSPTSAHRDRRPPEVTILPPTQDLAIGPGLPFDLPVQVSDEGGVAEVRVEVAGEAVASFASLAAAGSSGGILTFEVDVPGGAVAGPTVVVYAVAEDLAGNIAAAEPLTLTVDPAITIAVPAGLAGSKLLEGVAGEILDDPAAIERSPKDGYLYVADNSGGATCGGGCIRQVDPTTGMIAAGAVFVGAGRIEGLAFDATGDTLFLSDRPDRLVRLTYTAGVGYGGATQCVNAGASDPDQPFHLVVDTANGVVVVDQGDDRLKKLAVADCSPISSPTDVTGGTFTNAWGLARLPDGDYVVSDEGSEEIVRVSAAGVTSLYEALSLKAPRGIAWLSGGSSAFADALFVASTGSKRIVATRGTFSSRTAVHLRNEPVDVALAPDRTLFVLTQPSNGDRGRIYKVTGY